MLSIALSAANGSKTLGVISSLPPRPVLYMALEDSDRRMKDRCGLLGWTQIPELFEYVTRATPEQTLQTAWDWLWAHRGQRPLVIIDTLGEDRPAGRPGRDHLRPRLPDRHPAGPAQPGQPRHVGLGQPPHPQAGRRRLHRPALRYPGRGRVCGHHRAAGAQARRDHGRAEGHRPRRPGRGRLPALQLPGLGAGWRQPGRGSQPGARSGKPGKLGDRSAAILELVEQGGQVTTGEVAEAAGIGPDTASVYLKRLAESGYILKPERGIWRSATVSLVPLLRVLGVLGI